MRQKLKLRLFIQRLRSVKLAVILFSLIAVFCIVASLLPNGGRLFRSVPFLLICSLFALNLLACAVQRAMFRHRSFGSTAIHISILLIMTGGLVGFLFGEKGTIQFYEGEFTTHFHDGKTSRPLPFALALVDFEVERYPARRHACCGRLLVHHLQTGEVNRFPARVGEKISAGNYQIEILKFIPDFAWDSETHQAISRSEQPLNPAIQVALVSPEVRNHRWLFSNFPTFDMGDPLKGIRLIYETHVEAGPVKDFKSRLAILEEGKSVLEKTIEVNDPLQYQGYTFYQTDYDPDRPNWTGLQVARDPGIPLVYTGFILLLAGLCHVFIVKPSLKKRGASG